MSYPGKLDSDIGSMSLEAIQRYDCLFLRDLIERTRLDRKLKARMNAITIIADVLFKLNKRHIGLLMFHTLLEHVFPILIDKKTDKLEGGEMANDQKRKKKK